MGTGTRGVRGLGPDGLDRFESAGMERAAIRMEKRAPRHGMAFHMARSGSRGGMHPVDASADPRVSQYPIPWLPTVASDDSSEDLPVGDTHGGRPWKTDITIPAFCGLRQGASRRGATGIGCHSDSRASRWSAGGTRFG
jgi:hypothetical protein